MPRCAAIAGTRNKKSVFPSPLKGVQKRPKRLARKIAEESIEKYVLENAKKTKKTTSGINEPRNCFDRRSLTDRQPILVVSPKTDGKLKTLNSTLTRIVQIPAELGPSQKENEENDGYKFTVQAPPFTSPLNFKIQSKVASPCEAAFCPAPLLSPNTQERAKEIPVSNREIKSVSVRIYRKDLEHIKKRIGPREKFNDLSAQQLSRHENIHQNEIRYEFLHLQAHSLGGSSSPKNIVVGSWCANTQMMVFDDLAKLFIKQGKCQYIDVCIDCIMEKKSDGSGYTEQAKEIRASYTTDIGFTFSHTLDAHSTQRPSVNNDKLTSKTIKEMYSSVLFFKPQEQQNKEEGKEEELGDQDQPAADLQENIDIEEGPTTEESARTLPRRRTLFL